MRNRRRWIAGVSGVLVGLSLAACGVLGGRAGQTPAQGEAGTGQPGAAGEQPGETVPSATATPFKSELVICAPDDPDTLYDLADPVAAAILRLVSPPAAVYGEDYVAEPGSLLSLPGVEDGSLRVNEDGSITVRLHYRSDLVWSDGHPFDPVTDPALGLSLPALPSAPTFEVLDVQVGDASIEVTAAPGVEYPYVPSRPPLPHHVFGQQVDAQALADEGYTRLLNPTLGPYYLSEVRQDDQSMVFAANPHYPGAEALIPVLRLRFIPDPNRIAAELLGGGCDVALDGSLSVDQLAALLEAQNNGQTRLYIRPGPVYERAIFNTYPDPFSGQVPYFADARVRQAFVYAVDRAALGQGAFGSAGVPLDSWIPPQHWAYPGPEALTVYPYDPATAAALLDQAGWVDLDGDGTREYHGQGGVYACQRGEWHIEAETPLAPTLLIPAGDALRQQIASRLQTGLAQVGVNLNVQPVEPGVMFAPDGPITHRAFDVALLSGVARPDPGGIGQWVGADVYRHPLELTVVHRWDLADRWLTSEQLVELLAPNNVPGPENDYQGQNFAGWCSEAANVAIVEANLALSLDERKAFYAQQQALFTQEVPEMPLFARPRIAASAPYVCGIRPGPYDPLTWNVDSWYFDESGACGR
jgi:peptide/nickel transport system substrate-binding protein